MSFADCHPDRPHKARRLCSTCYNIAWYAGTIEQHPGARRTFCLAVAEDAAWVLECGCRCHRDGPMAVHGNGRGCPCGGTRALADRLGMSRDALTKALQRARRRGVTVA